jgi:hypothetical protein
MVVLAICSRHLLLQGRNTKEGQVIVLGILFNENPLVVNVELAKKIGLNESIILQQLHYWLEINRKAGRNQRSGYYWTYNTYEEWQQQFPFWSLSTIKRTFAKLEKGKFIITDNYNKLKIDRTKWYRINYDLLETLENAPKCQSDTMESSKWNDGKCQNEPTITIDYPENTSENYSYGNLADAKTSKCHFNDFCYEYPVDFKVKKVIHYYLSVYRQYMGKEHPNLPAEQWQGVIHSLFLCEDEYGNDLDIDFDTMKQMIDKHFTTKYKNCNYSILHFNTNGIKLRRFYEIDSE